MQFIALTATATPTVRAALKRTLFKLDPDGERDGFREVYANPIRENLALYRLALGPGEGGTVTKAGIIEGVVDCLDEHAIFYTLTVKEAISLHNHIQTYLGDSEQDRVLLFHGRLSDHAKASVSNAFKDAPSKSDDPEEFRPLIVVATSAFGLGIDRPDIRTVFCVSPPTDLSALYQQVGRAGRDGTPSFGLMMATRRGFSTVDFMTRTEDQQHVIERAVRKILEGQPPLDMANLAGEFVEDDLEAKRIEHDDAMHIAGQYQIAVARVFAELVTVGMIDDLGDFPDRARISKGEMPYLDADDAAFVSRVWATMDSPRDQAMEALWKGGQWSDFGVEDIGQLWSNILAFHAMGYLDVSQQLDFGH